MPSTASTRNRLELQAVGENSNTWGTKLVTALEMIDVSLDGVEDIVTEGASTTLTNVDYTADQAKNRSLYVTGTGGTIVVPNVEKIYYVDATAATGSVIISTGSGTTATIPAGNALWVVSTGSNVVRMQPNYSGTYTPTVITQSDAAPTVYAVQYMRVGKTVTMSGKIDITAGATGTAPYIIIDTPINSAFTSEGQASGTGLARINTSCQFIILAESANRLRLSFNVSTTDALTYWFTATYQVV